MTHSKTYAQRMRKVLLGLLFAFYCGLANGQTNTYTGPNNGIWENAANWSLGILPTPTQDVVISNTSVRLTTATTAFCQSLTMDLASQFTIEPPGVLFISFGNGVQLSDSAELIIEGDLIVSDSPNGITMSNASSVVNIGGIIDIGSIPGSAIELNDNSTWLNEGMLLTEDSRIGIHCRDNSLFTNADPDGNITIQNADERGVLVDNNAAYTNDSDLILFQSNFALDGIALECIGTFNNDANGILFIAQYNNPNDLGILVSGDLINAGEIEMEFTTNGIEVVSSGHILNLGIIDLSSIDDQLILLTGPSTMARPNLRNEGLIEYIYIDALIPIILDNQAYYLELNTLESQNITLQQSMAVRNSSVLNVQGLIDCQSLGGIDIESNSRLIGNGRINSTVHDIVITSNAAISPGIPGGVIDELTINSNLIIDGGVAEFDVHNTSGPGLGHDLISVTGMVDISNAAEIITRTNGYVPATGFCHEVITAPPAGSGTFATETHQNFPFDVQYQAGNQVVELCGSDLACSIIGTDADCFGESTGAANATISGGAGPYTFSWSNGAMSEDLNNIPAGSYTLTVTDNVGSMTTCSVVINQPTTFTCATSNVIPVTVFGGNNGGFDITVTGGTVNYSYDVLDSGSTSVASGTVTTSGGSATITGLSADTYTVNITDAMGCMTSCNAIVPQPALLQCGIVGMDADCNGAATGSANATITGGTGPFTYSWSNGAMTEDITSIPAGNYTLNVTDFAGAMTSCNVVIGEPTALSCTIVGQDALCFNSATGSANAIISGGTAPFNYSWSNGAMTEDLSNIAAGMYTLTVTDDNGCMTSCSVTIDEPTRLQCTLSGVDILCNGDSTGSVRSSVEGGTPPYQYSWNTGRTTRHLNNIPAGTYELTITDALGCMTTCSVTLTEPPAISAVISQDIIPCEGDFATATVVPIGGVPPYDLLWDTGETNATATDLLVGQHSVLITDDNDCTFREFIQIQEYPEYNYDELIEVCEAISYVWPDGSVTPVEPGEYEHTSELLTINGCDSIINSTLRIHEIQFPSAFSPNGNGRNEQFILLNNISCPVTDFSITIFNRWGEQVFESVDVNVGWDGRHNGQRSPAGLYVYVAEYETTTGKVVRNGSLHLLQ